MDLPQDEAARFYRRAHYLIKNVGGQKAISGLDEAMASLRAELNGMRIFDEERYRDLTVTIWDCVLMKRAIKELIEKDAIV